MEQRQKSNRRNKGGRPKKGAADKLKYRLTVKMATSDYYTLKGKARSAGHAGTYGLHPPALWHGEQPQPTCAQG